MTLPKLRILNTHFNSVSDLFFKFFMNSDLIACRNFFAFRDQLQTFLKLYNKKESQIEISFDGNKSILIMSHQFAVKIVISSLLNL